MQLPREQPQMSPPWLCVWGRTGLGVRQGGGSGAVCVSVLGGFHSM